jgi:hypothetical protein
MEFTTSAYFAAIAMFAVFGAIVVTKSYLMSAIKIRFTCIRNSRCGWTASVLLFFKKYPLGLPLSGALESISFFESQVHSMQTVYSFVGIKAKLIADLAEGNHWYTLAPTQ